MLQVKILKDREHHNHKGNIQNIKVFDCQKTITVLYIKKNRKNHNNSK